MLDEISLFEVIKLFLSVTAGAGVGSIVATKITFKQVEHKTNIDLEDLSKDIEEIRAIMEGIRELRNSEEGEKLIEISIDSILTANELLHQIREHPLLNNTKGGDKNGKKDS
ncbi:MAG: hypothetical protein ACOC44_18300 [Promethearchaeia archaeon]